MGVEPTQLGHETPKLLLLGLRDQRAPVFLRVSGVEAGQQADDAHIVIGSRCLCALQPAQCTEHAQCEWRALLHNLVLVEFRQTRQGVVGHERVRFLW